MSSASRQRKREHRMENSKHAFDRDVHRVRQYTQSGHANLDASACGDTFRHITQANTYLGRALAYEAHIAGGEHDKRPASIVEVERNLGRLESEYLDRCTLK